MKTSITAVSALVLTTVSVFAQVVPDVRVEPGISGARVAPAAIAPAAPAALAPALAAPAAAPAAVEAAPVAVEAAPAAVEAAPNVNVSRSEAAASEDHKLRVAMALFRHRSVTLEQTTTVTLRDDETYSVRADFTVDGESVSIRCVSAIRDAVVAFLQYLNRLFGDDATRTDWSLEKIVNNARQNIMDRFDLSEDQLTVTYIDQFDNTHVVHVSIDRSESKFASR